MTALHTQCINWISVCVPHARTPHLRVPVHLQLPLYSIHALHAYEYALSHECVTRHALDVMCRTPHALHVMCHMPHLTCAICVPYASLVICHMPHMTSPPSCIPYSKTCKYTLIRRCTWIYQFDISPSLDSIYCISIRHAAPTHSTSLAHIQHIPRPALDTK